MADGNGSSAKEVLLGHPKGFNEHILDAYLAEMAGRPYPSRPYRTEKPYRENDASRNWRAVARPVEQQVPETVDVSDLQWAGANQIGQVTPKRLGRSGWQLVVDAPVQEGAIILKPDEQDLYNNAKKGKNGLTVVPYVLRTKGEVQQIQTRMVAVLRKAT